MRRFSLKMVCFFVAIALMLSQTSALLWILRPGLAFRPLITLPIGVTTTTASTTTGATTTTTTTPRSTPTPTQVSAGFVTGQVFNQSALFPQLGFPQYFPQLGVGGQFPAGVGGQFLGGGQLGGQFLGGGQLGGQLRPPIIGGVAGQGFSGFGQIGGGYAPSQVTTVPLISMLFGGLARPPVIGGVASPLGK